MQGEKELAKLFLHDYDIYLGGIIWGKIKEDSSIDDFSGNTLYMVNERFYDTLLSVPEEKDFDRVVAYRGKFFVCNPMIVMQHNGFSDNKKKYIDFGPYTKRIKLYRNKQESTLLKNPPDLP